MIIDDWNFDYPNKIAEHIDGVLSYGTGSGTQPVNGQFIIGATSGAIARVISTTGTVVTGTLTITDVIGRFVNGEALSILDELPFDGITANGGFKVGDTIIGPTTESIDVKFIDYNLGATSGEGTIYGDNLTTGFADAEQLDVSGGATNVAVANGADVSVTFAATTTTALVVPGTTNTNNSVIVHYDVGTIGIPEESTISDATTGAIGLVQRVDGDVVTGSIRLVNSNTTGGAWTNNNNIDIEDVIFYNNLVGGQVFAVGDLVVGVTSTEEATVLAIIDDGDNSGKLITRGKTGVFTVAEDLNLKRRGGNLVTPEVKIAEVENSTDILATVAVINTPNGVRDEQRVDQGGIYPAGSLNIKRGFNAFYTHAVTTFALTDQIDDKSPLNANVKDQVYSGINGWKIRDLSLRFLESGSYQDETGDNIFTNYQTDVAAPTIGNHGYFYDATNPTPQPDLYIVQNGVVIRQDWLEGNLNVIIKVKTNTDPAIINFSVAALGQLIDGGNAVVNARPYPFTYDYSPVSQVSGVAPISLAIFTDASNISGQYRYSFNTGGAGAFTVGEEIIGGTSGARATVQDSDSGATGNVDYALKGSTQFQDAEVITGQVSAKTATTDGAGLSNLVVGYNADVRTMVVSRRFTGGSTTGTYIIGEQVTQTGTGATGFVLRDDGGTVYVEDNTGAFNGTGLLTGDTSGATNTPTATASFTTVPYDLGDGSGETNYTGVVSADITDANPRSITDVYEWSKFITDANATFLFKEEGDASITTTGNIFRALNAFQPVRSTGGPIGAKPGAVMSFNQGWFMVKETLITADLQNFTVTNNAGTLLTPPNLQAFEFTGGAAGYGVAAYRADGAGSQIILRNEFDVGTVGGGNNQAADSTILLGANTRGVSPLPSDVPDVGWLRILDPNDTGNYLLFKYDQLNRATNIATLQQGIGQNTIGDVTGSVDLTLDDNVHVVPISDTMSGSTISNILQYVADFPYVTIARLKGFDDEVNVGTFTANGASQPIRQDADPIVDLP